MRKTNRWMMGVLAALLGVGFVAGCGGKATKETETHKEGDDHDHKEGEKH